MTISEKPLEGFDNKLKNFKKNYPQCQCGNCPQFFFNYLAVASRNSGKTYSTVQLLKHYEMNDLISPLDGKKHPLRIFLISPTTEANQIYRSLKNLKDEDIFEEYSDELIQDIINDIVEKKTIIDEFKWYKEAYDLVKRTPSNKLVNLYQENKDLFKILEKYQFITPQELKEELKLTSEEYNVNIIILDDLMGSSAFTQKRQSKLTNLCIKNRHNYVSFFILVQNLKSVPKAIRSNCNVYFLGKFASKKVILEDMYEEVSNVLTMEQFDELYTKATEGENNYGALIIDNSTPKKRFFQNFEKELFIE